MSEEQNTESQNGTQSEGVDTVATAAAAEQQEKEILRTRLRSMGKNPSNNAGVDTLRRMWEETRNGIDSKEEEAAPAAPMPGAEVALVAPKGKVKTLAQHLRDENMKLVRVRITCLDPKKKDLPGEIITVGNNILGAVKKFVPYGEATDDGYHIPFIIYKFLLGRKFVDIRVTKDRQTGREVVHRRMVKEYGIEVLPQLTPAQLQKLATAQLAAGSSGE